MTTELKTLTAMAYTLNSGRTYYRVAYDGRFYGDSRAYSNEAECDKAIDDLIATDKRDAVRYERPIMYRKG